MFWSLIITLGLISGQLIRLPIAYANVTLLDLSISLATLFGLIKIKFKFERFPLYIGAAFVFIFVSILSLIFTPLHLNSTELMISYFYIIRFFIYILFGLVIFQKSYDIKTSRVLTLSGIGLAVLGLGQFIFLPDLSFLTKWGWDPHYFRTVSTFLDPNFAGAFFSLTLLILPRSPRLFALVYLALLTTFSRSSYLMFLISGLIMKRYFKTVVLFIILLLAFQIYTKMVSKPRHIDREQSASFRLSTWQQGWQLFAKHPLLGVGFNAYKYAIREYRLGDDQFLESRGSTSNDSSLLFVLATTGVLGFTVYLLFLISLLRVGNSYLMAVISGLLIHSVFANSLFYPPILLWIMLVSSIPKK